MGKYYTEEEILVKNYKLNKKKLKFKKDRQDKLDDQERKHHGKK